MHTETQREHAYHQILHHLSERTSPKSSADGGQLIAVTSSSRGEGVSYIVSSLAAQLSLQYLSSVSTVDATMLTGYSGGAQTIGNHFVKQGERYKFQGTTRDSHAPDVAAAYWYADRDFRIRCMQELRRRFNYVLFDCPPPKESGEVYSLAPLVDGVVLVVEANKTKKDHIKNLERMIEFANGHVAGYVLNRREYVIPNWLYSRL